MFLEEAHTENGKYIVLADTKLTTRWTVNMMISISGNGEEQASVLHHHRGGQHRHRHVFGVDNTDTDTCFRALPWSDPLSRMYARTGGTQGGEEPHVHPRHRGGW